MKKFRKEICIISLLSVLVLCSSCGEKKEVVETTETTITTESESVVETTKAFTEDDYAPYKDLKLLVIGNTLINSCKNELTEGFTTCYIDTSCTEVKKSDGVFNSLVSSGADFDVLVYAMGSNLQETLNTDPLQKIYKKLNGKKMIIVSTCMPFKGQARNRDRLLKEFVNSHEGCYFLDLRDVEKKCPGKIDYEKGEFYEEAAKEFVKELKYTIVKAYES